MLMFNGFAQVRKTCNTDHPLQYSVNDNYLQAQINTTRNIHVVTTLSAAQPNLITKKEPFSYLGFVRLRTGWIKKHASPKRTARMPKYHNLPFNNSIWMTLLTYVATRATFKKIPLTVFLHIWTQLLSLFTKFSFHNLFFTNSRCWDVRNNFWFVPIIGNNILAADR